jgi:hypothetical protein
MGGKQSKDGHIQLKNGRFLHYRRSDRSSMPNGSK